MSRVCDLTGKRRLVGNRVSHANNKTKMTQRPNLHTKRVFDPVTGGYYSNDLGINILDSVTGGYFS